MNIHFKRILILFSIALNIGFIVFALSNRCTLTKSHHQGIREKLISIVQSLNLPQSNEKEALDCINGFSETMQSQDRSLSKSRDDILLYLAKPGPIDPELLNTLVMKVDGMEKIKRELFSEHVIELRDIMGEEKGPLFFSLMLAQIGHSQKKH